MKTIRILKEIVEMYKVKIIIFFALFLSFFIYLLFFYSIRMLDISIENYKNEKVNIVAIYNGELLWVKMNDVKMRLGVKNMSDLVRKEIHGVYITKTPTEEQIREYKRREKELDGKSSFSFRYVCNDTMSRIIKSCRGEKKIDNFRIGL